MWFRRLKIAWVEERDFNNWFSRRGCFPFIGIPSHDPTSGRARPPGTGSAIHIWAMLETLIYSSSSQHSRLWRTLRPQPSTHQSIETWPMQRTSHVTNQWCVNRVTRLSNVSEKGGMHRLVLMSTVSDKLASNWSIFLFVLWNKSGEWPSGKLIRLVTRMNACNWILSVC